jgi:hypothetical protein
MPLKPGQDNSFEIPDVSPIEPAAKVGKQKRKYARLQAARVAFHKIKADRELWEQAGIGPGDSYLALWSHLIELRNQWHSQQNDEGKRYYSERYVEVLTKLLPYERPRLAVVKVRSEAENQHIPPEEMARALAKSLTEEELALLDKVALKLVAPAQIDGKAEPTEYVSTAPPKPGKRRS